METINKNLATKNQFTTSTFHWIAFLIPTTWFEINTWWFCEFSKLASKVQKWKIINILNTYLKSCMSYQQICGFKHFWCFFLTIEDWKLERQRPYLYHYFQVLYFVFESLTEDIMGFLKNYISYQVRNTLEFYYWFRTMNWVYQLEKSMILKSQKYKAVLSILEVKFGIQD